MINRAWVYGYNDQRQDIEEAMKSLRRQLEIIDEWA